MEKKDIVSFILYPMNVGTMYNRQWSNVNSFGYTIWHFFGVFLKIFKDFTLIQIWSIQEYDLKFKFCEQKRGYDLKNT